MLTVVMLLVAMVTISSPVLAKDEFAKFGDYKVSTSARSSMEVVSEYLDGGDKIIISSMSNIPSIPKGTFMGGNQNFVSNEGTEIYQKTCAIADIDFDKVIVKAEADLLYLQAQEDSRSIAVGKGPIYVWSPVAE